MNTFNFNICNYPKQNLNSQYYNIRLLQKYTVNLKFIFKNYLIKGEVLYTITKRSNVCS